MNESIFLLDKFIFPIFSVTQNETGLQLKRFIGSGFWIDTKGHFITCKHVFENVADEELPAIGQPFGNRRDHYVPILSSYAHPKFDIAVGKAPASSVTGVLAHYRGTVGIGVDVQAFGFTDAGKEQMSYQLDVRLLRGYISRCSPDSLGLPSPSLLEVSFGSPSGFSGTPLLVGREVIGILYRNVDSKLEAYSINETTENGAHFKEIAYRIYEYGIAHNLSELTPFLNECCANE
jgi:hypothetical protein